jgi:hypothetical protein
LTKERLANAERTANDAILQAVPREGSAPLRLTRFCSSALGRLHSKGLDPRSTGPDEVEFISEIAPSLNRVGDAPESYGDQRFEVTPPAANAVLEHVDESRVKLIAQQYADRLRSERLVAPGSSGPSF